MSGTESAGKTLAAPDLQQLVWELADTTWVAALRLGPAAASDTSAAVKFVTLSSQGDLLQVWQWEGPGSEGGPARRLGSLQLPTPLSSAERLVCAANGLVAVACNSPPRLYVFRVEDAPAEAAAPAAAADAADAEATAAAPAEATATAAGVTIRAVGDSALPGTHVRGSPDTECFVSVCSGGVLIWELGPADGPALVSRALPRPFSGSLDPPDYAEFLPGGRLAVGNSGGRCSAPPQVAVLDVATGKVLPPVLHFPHTQQGLDKNIGCMRALPNDRLLVSWTYGASGDTELHLADVRTGAVRPFSSQKERAIENAEPLSGRRLLVAIDASPTQFAILDLGAPYGSEEIALPNHMASLEGYCQIAEEGGERVPLVVLTTQAAEKHWVLTVHTEDDENYRALVLG